MRAKVEHAIIVDHVADVLFLFRYNQVLGVVEVVIELLTACFLLAERALWQVLCVVPVLRRQDDALGISDSKMTRLNMLLSREHDVELLRDRCQSRRTELGEEFIQELLVKPAETGSLVSGESLLLLLYSEKLPEALLSVFHEVCINVTSIHRCNEVHSCRCEIVLIQVDLLAVDLALVFGGAGHV